MTKYKNNYIFICFLFLTISSIVNCNKVWRTDSGQQVTEKNSRKINNKGIIMYATFGNGCFWCTEAIFLRLKGVSKVTSGYSRGYMVDPTYQEVTTGTTGHAEVVQIEYDPSVISYRELLEVFWKTHDPTTLNQQGNDVGTQYRSIVLFHNKEQKSIATALKNELEGAKIWKNPIVTEIKELSKFYSAEKYHQNYYERNSNQGYCQFVILPKIEKFKKVFNQKLKLED